MLGHSYGGSVITGVRGAGHLIYLAAFVLDTGESAAGLGGATPQLQDAINPEPDGSTSLDPDRAVDTLYGDCSTEDGRSLHRGARVADGPLPVRRTARPHRRPPGGVHAAPGRTVIPARCPPRA
ncbi:MULTISPECIES: hypothetical protein [unclassified Streptomyces]|uniref:hypothetical protein n=1 Tax=unclassified Streptomyces TaxID=2593676 RepID=UPI0036EBE7FC